MSDSDLTPDETAGMKWWRELSESGKAYWLEIASRSASKPLPAEAWEAFKRVTARASVEGPSGGEEPMTVDEFETRVGQLVEAARSAGLSDEVIADVLQDAAQGQRKALS